MTPSGLASESVIARRRLAIWTTLVAGILLSLTGVAILSQPSKPSPASLEPVDPTAGLGPRFTATITFRSDSSGDSSRGIERTGSGDAARCQSPSVDAVGTFDPNVPFAGFTPEARVDLMTNDHSQLASGELGPGKVVVGAAGTWECVWVVRLPPANFDDPGPFILQIGGYFSESGVIRTGDTLRSDLS